MGDPRLPFHRCVIDFILQKLNGLFVRARASWMQLVERRGLSFGCRREYLYGSGGFHSPSNLGYRGQQLIFCSNCVEIGDPPYIVAHFWSSADRHRLVATLLIPRRERVPACLAVFQWKGKQIIFLILIG